VKKIQFEPTPQSESLQPSPKKEETPEQKATRKILNFMYEQFLGEGKKAEPEDEYMTQFSYQPPTLFGFIGDLAGQAASSASSLLPELPDADLFRPDPQPTPSPAKTKTPESTGRRGRTPKTTNKSPKEAKRDLISARSIAQAFSSGSLQRMGV
jgi:hypothetical protein